MAEMRTKDSKRLLHLDLLRLIAIYLVIFNHTGNRGYMLFADRTGEPLYFLYMVCSILCKVAVPVFFMISGALLLPKQESLGKLFSRRILRMIVVLVLISVPYYVWLHRDHGLHLLDFLAYIYGNSASTPLWYLYSYISMLLMMPFLRSMVKSMTEGDYIYLIVGYLVMTGCLPCTEYCLSGGDVFYHMSFRPALFLSQNCFYAVVGYYLEHILDIRKHKKSLIGVGLLFSATAVVLTCFMTHRLVETGIKDTAQLERFFNCFICVPAMYLYMLIKYATEKMENKRLENITSALGGAVFGVYLIEKFSRALTGFVYMFLAPLLGCFAAVLIWCGVVLVMSLAIVLIMKHMHGLEKIVNRFI